jgi:homoserine dehydrogenase
VSVPSNLLVLKLGGSVLRDEASLALAAREVYRWVRRGRRVIAVVSALGGATDALLSRARAVAGGAPPDGPLAALLSTGESGSAALLALALDRAGVPAEPLDVRGAGIATDRPGLDAEPAGLVGDALTRVLERVPVAVVPGFAGVAPDGSIALLGRGGSDLTALFLASRLGARCRLVKDVDGVFERDPRDACSKGPPRRYASLTWRDAARVGGAVLQPKAVRLAARGSLDFEVAAAGSSGGTRVGAAPSVLAGAHSAARPLRVALLGLGTVGAGVAAGLAAEPERFQLVRALVRDPSRDRDVDLAPGVLTDDPADALDTEVDVVVEVAGGTDPAGRWLEAALERGRHVVTANKALLAADGEALAALARARGRRLLGSAAVGGAVPMLESARRARRLGGLLALAGVLNGTTSFVLDEVARGASLGAAVSKAQQAGLAEADPALDLDGTDAVQKAELLSRAAFGAAPAWRTRVGVLDLDEGHVREEAARGRTVRLVARVWAPVGGAAPEAELALEALAPDAPLAGLSGADCALHLVHADGSDELVRGTGAGRWPTAEAVLADLGDLARAGVQPVLAPTAAEVLP